MWVRCCLPWLSSCNVGAVVRPSRTQPPRQVRLIGALNRVHLPAIFKRSRSSSGVGLWPGCLQDTGCHCMLAAHICPGFLSSLKGVQISPCGRGIDVIAVKSIESSLSYPLLRRVFRAHWHRTHHGCRAMAVFCAPCKTCTSHTSWLSSTFSGDGQGTP